MFYNVCGSNNSFTFFCETELPLAPGENQRWRDTLKIILPKSNHVISLNDKREKEKILMKFEKIF